MRQEALASARLAGGGGAVGYGRDGDCGSLDVAEGKEEGRSKTMKMIRNLCGSLRRTACEASRWEIGLERGYWMTIVSVLLVPIISSWPARGCASHTSLSIDKRSLIIECLQPQCTLHH